MNVQFNLRFLNEKNFRSDFYSNFTFVYSFTFSLLYKNLRNFYLKLRLRGEKP